MAGQLLLVNPAKRGKKKSTKRAAPATKRPARRSTTSLSKLRKRTRRNPIMGGSLLKGVTGQVKSAAVGALGGALLDAMLRPLPMNMKAGNVGHLTRAGIAIAAGIVGKRHPMIASAAQGALTITLYNVLRQYVTVPMNLGEISDADMNAYVQDGGMGEYVGGVEDDGMPQLGFTGSAVQMEDEDNVGEYVGGYETGAYR
jgi:hypothetical protein